MTTIYTLIGVACIAAGLGAAAWLHWKGERDDRHRNLPAEIEREQRERWER